MRCGCETTVIRIRMVRDFLQCSNLGGSEQVHRMAGEPGWPHIELTGLAQAMHAEQYEQGYQQAVREMAMQHGMRHQHGMQEGPALHHQHQQVMQTLWPGQQQQQGNMWSMGVGPGMTLHVQPEVATARLLQHQGGINFGSRMQAPRALMPPPFVPVPPPMCPVAGSVLPLPMDAPV